MLLFLSVYGSTEHERHMEAKQFVCYLFIYLSPYLSSKLASINTISLANQYNYWWNIILVL